VSTAGRRETLRRLTVTTTVVAIVLNAVLFVQTAAQQLGPGDVNNAILAVIGSLLPGGVRQPSEAPVPTPSPPLAVTGGS
jgi:hypothetical protein